MKQPEQKLRVFPVALAAEPQLSAYFTLGLLLSHAKVHKEGLLKNAFLFDPITPFTLADADAILDRLRSENLPVVFLLSSYVWNHDDNLAFARLVREKLPGSLTVIGGPNIPKADKPCRQFLNTHHCIDVAVQGEGEVTLAALLESLMMQYDGESADIRWLDLSDVPGLTYRKPDLQLVRTESRARIHDINIIPSPYLTGEYDHLPGMPWSVVIETNRGCPFACTFCDWGGATMSKINRFELQRVLDEIEYLAMRGVERITVADANFGAFERDITIAEKLLEMKRKYGFPQTVHYFLAKNSPERVARIVRILNEEKMMVDIVASLQTTDPVTLENIGRKNIKESAYASLIDAYVEIGLEPETDFLIGLPGQDYQTFRKDLQFAFDRNLYGRTFMVSVLPNSPMGDEAYRKKFEIVTDENGVVISTYSMDAVERNRILDLRMAYMFLVDEKVLKPVICYLQFEHGILAMDLIEALMGCAPAQSDRYTKIALLCNRITRQYVWAGTVSIKWNHKDGREFFLGFDGFLQEVMNMVGERFGIVPEHEEWQALGEFILSLMPLPGIKAGPFDVMLDYDVPAYVEQFRRGVPVAGVLSHDRSVNRLSAFRQKKKIGFPWQDQLDWSSFAYNKTTNQPGWPMQYE